MEAAIQVSGLRVVRGGRVVLPSLSCRVAAGRVTGLLGPSGSGKTTLLRAVVGVQRIAGGAVTVLGRPAGSPALRATVAYMTQAPSVYGDLTVGDNLAYFGRVLGTTAARRRAVMDAVDLLDHEHDLVRDLSGGETARVSLATALLAEPAVLVLDEPTVGLDPLLRRQLWSLFAELASAGTTLLVSSHVMDEAARCDDLLLLRNGGLLYEGGRRQLLEETGTDGVNDAFLTLIEGRS